MSTDDMRQYFEADGSPRRLDARATDTPRTDAVLFGRLCYIKPENDMKVMYDFARTLERELGAARAKISRLKKNEAICHCGEAISAHGMDCGHSPVELNEECPYAHELIEGRRKLAELEEVAMCAKRSKEEAWTEQESLEAQLNAAQTRIAELEHQLAEEVKGIAKLDADRKRLDWLAKQSAGAYGDYRAAIDAAIAAQKDSQ